MVSEMRYACLTHIMDQPSLFVALLGRRIINGKEKYVL